MNNVCNNENTEPFIVADIDSKKVYNADDILSALYLVNKLKGNRLHVSLASSNYYHRRLLTKDYSVVEAKFSLSKMKEFKDFFDELSDYTVSSPEWNTANLGEQVGLLVTTLNDLIFEDYAHRHTDVIDYLSGILGARKELIQYGFDSTAGVTYFIVDNSINLLKCLEQVAQH